VGALRQPSGPMSRDQVEAEVQDDDEKGQLLPDAEKGSGGGTLLEHDEEQRPLSPRQRAAGFARARLGLLMALGGTLTFSLMTVSVRLIPFFGPPVPVFLIVIVRGCIVTSSSLWSLCRRGISPLGPVPYRGWLVFRGSMGFTALSSYYYGLYHLRVADAVVLQKTTPILVCIIAALWLGEKFGPYDLGASLLCLGGVAMVVQSEDEPTPVDTSPTAAGQPAGRMSADVAAAAADPDEVDWVKVGAVLIVLGSALSSALAYTTIRKLKTDPRGLTVDPMVLVLYFAFICVPGGAVGLWLGEDAVPWAEVTIEQVRNRV
jgi:drug/metabolite transporter (DMT)-like permease